MFKTSLIIFLGRPNIPDVLSTLAHRKRISFWQITLTALLIILWAFSFTWLILSLHVKIISKISLFINFLRSHKIFLQNNLLKLIFFQNHCKNFFYFIGVISILKKSIFILRVHTFFYYWLLILNMLISLIKQFT